MATVFEEGQESVSDLGRVPVSLRKSEVKILLKCRVNTFVTGPIRSNSQAKEMLRDIRKLVDVLDTLY